MYVLIQCMSSYNVCSHTMYVLIQCMFSYNVCPHTMYVLIQCMSSYNVCSHTMYVLKQCCMDLILRSGSYTQSFGLLNLFWWGTYTFCLWHDQVCMYIGLYDQCRSYGVHTYIHNREATYLRLIFWKKTVYSFIYWQLYSKIYHICMYTVVSHTSKNVFPFKTLKRPIFAQSTIGSNQKPLFLRSWNSVTILSV
jgi:hypothetical protein